LAIHTRRKRLLEAVAWSAAFVLLIGLTVIARGIQAASGDDAPPSLAEVLNSDTLRFGTQQEPLAAYAPLALAAPAAPPPLSGTSQYAFIWPNDYYLVQGLWAGHPLGIDVGSPPGDPVRAVRNGRVIFAGGDPCCSYGRFVIIEHDDGWSSLYAHLEEIDVASGDDVKQGQVFALSGGSGHVTGPHLHFELRHNGGIVDPLAYLEPARDWVPTAELIAELRDQSTPADTNAAPADAVDASSGDSGPVSAGEEIGVAGLSSADAIGAASSWLANQDESAYYIDPSGCSAAQSGPNWWVTCSGELQGCSGRACVREMTVCVFDQPRLVTAACP
jgi:hypothetical protein